MKKHLSPSIWCLLFLAASWASCDNNDAKLQDEPETKTVTCPGDGACLPTGGADLWFSEPDDGYIKVNLGNVQPNHDIHMTYVGYTSDASGNSGFAFSTNYKLPLTQSFMPLFTVSEATQIQVNLCCDNYISYPTVGDLTCPNCKRSYNYAKTSLQSPGVANYANGARGLNPFRVQPGTENPGTSIRLLADPSNGMFSEYNTFVTRIKIIDLTIQAEVTEKDVLFYTNISIPLGMTGREYQIQFYNSHCNSPYYYYMNFPGGMDSATKWGGLRRSDMY